MSGMTSFYVKGNLHHEQATNRKVANSSRFVRTFLVLKLEAPHPGKPLSPGKTGWCHPSVMVDACRVSEERNRW